MATTPTNNQIPSEAVQDLKFNSGKIDEFASSDELKYTDRKGIERYTAAGLADKVNQMEPIKTYHITPGDPDGTIAGLAGTPNGESFRVSQGPNSDLSFIYYINEDGAAVVDAKQAGDLANSQPFISNVTEKVSNTVSTGLGETGMLAYIGESPIVPIFVDEKDKMVTGFNTKTEMLEGGVLSGGDVSNSFGDAGLLGYIGNGDVIPIITDINERVILGFDVNNQCLVGVFDDGSAKGFKLKKLNHFISYGQSLSLGVQGRPIISVSQPYLNVKFSGGVRGNGDFSSLIPLVEDLINQQVPTHTGGETPCSGTANYATILAWKLNGITPDNHVVLASAPGKGNTPIAELNKGSAQYDNYFLEHVRKGKALDDDYAVQAVGWLQGENDIGLGHDYEFYKPLFDQLIIDVKQDVRGISGQGFDPAFISYQLSYGTINTNAVARAQFEAFKERRAYLSCPTYRFTPNADNTHISNVMYKLMGAYQGRVWNQVVVGLREPDWLEPISATLSMDVVTVKFKVPSLPVKFNIDDISPTQDHGFAVLDTSGNKAIFTSIEASGDSVIITLPPGFDAKTVRYGYDYAPADNFSNASGGNLTDSTTDSVVIEGLAYTLMHCCPHFEYEIIEEVI